MIFGEQWVIRLQPIRIHLRHLALPHHNRAALHDAAKKGNLEVARFLLGMPAIVHASLEELGVQSTRTNDASRWVS